MRKLKVGDAEIGILARMLRTVDFFAPLTVGQFEKIIPCIMLYFYAAGETVFRQGEIGDAFYIVSKGKVDVGVKSGFFSFSKKVATLGPGSFFGEIALISTAPRTATVRCAEPAELFALVAGDFQTVLKENPAAAAEMAKIAARRKFEAEHPDS